eukprot:GHVT01010176.1.p1 GENE.GHVT01010176.1~~GHVT01010176.1.p1  ORF type:complete len:366 (+),score=9.22 GHVT01010176.1:555-1652(+)
MIGYKFVRACCLLQFAVTPSLLFMSACFQRVVGSWWFASHTALPSLVFADAVVANEIPFSVSTGDALYAPLPLPVDGTCAAGKVYTITKLSHIYDHLPEIECLWTQGMVPNKVPLGACLGKCLAFTNTAFLDYFTEFVYQGDYVVQTQCNGNYYNVGILNFAGIDTSTGIWTVSPLPSHFEFVEGEQYDGRAGVLMDFTVDVDHYCPAEGNERVTAPFLKHMRPFNTGRWPVRLFIDMLRAVGRDDADGCLLMVGRTWLLDPFPESKKLATVLYFMLKSCDPAIMPDYKIGTPLPAIVGRPARSSHFSNINFDRFFLNLLQDNSVETLYMHHLFSDCYFHSWFGFYLDKQSFSHAAYNICKIALK